MYFPVHSATTVIPVLKGLCLCWNKSDLEAERGYVVSNLSTGHFTAAQDYTFNSLGIYHKSEQD